MKEIKFGERLKELRQEKNIGQVELAAKIGVSKGIISSPTKSLASSSAWNASSDFDSPSSFITSFAEVFLCRRVPRTPQHIKNPFLHNTH